MKCISVPRVFPSLIGALSMVAFTACGGPDSAAPQAAAGGDSSSHLFAPIDDGCDPLDLTCASVKRGGSPR